ncbi:MULTISPECIES: hypothetical protein [unclassified Meiothermus]|uniref:hypothetical protein n=1 Tax=unclassified Meiothermus TaxID=370471 RepID=UPI001314B86A|nr:MULTISPECIES: hypothetical protein [unclassified Meiothermus]
MRHTSQASARMSTCPAWGLGTSTLSSRSGSPGLSSSIACVVRGSPVPILALRRLA